MTVVLRPRLKESARLARIHRLGGQLPHQREHPEAGDYTAMCGAHPDHVADVESFARAHGLTAVECSVARRCVVLRGPLEAISRAFRVELLNYGGPTLSYRSHEEALFLPAKLHECVEAVLGLDNRPVVAPLMALAASPVDRPTAPSEVAAQYGFPAGARGESQTIGIILPGGGFEEADMKAYFARLGQPMPKITVVEVLGQKNRAARLEDIELVRKVFHEDFELSRGDMPSFAAGLFTVEANLDVQLAGSFAGGAQIVVYFSPDTAEGHYHALTTALADEHNPGVLSCSWSGHESLAADQVLRSMETVFQSAALKGVTVCFSSGDDGDGSLWGGRSNQIDVHYPSSSAHVLACGGTDLVDGREQAWDEKAGKFRLASGGGFSCRVPRPAWQAGLGSSGGRCALRGVPDVAGKADVKGGYEIIAKGERFTMGGTSAAAPMWASLITLINEKLERRAGFLNPLLYSDRFRAATRDIVRGNNGAFKAGPGWDPCTGWGSPRGDALLEALRPG